MIDWEEIIWNGVAWHVLKANAVPMLIDEEKAILIDIRMNERRGRNGPEHRVVLVITETAELSYYTNWLVFQRSKPTFCDQGYKK